MNQTADNPLLLERQVCFPLYAATHLMQRLYRPLLVPLGLTYSQYLVMLVVWESRVITVGKLGDCLHLDSGTLTPLLKRMEKAGFITRRRDPQDQRSVQIESTVLGRKLRAQAAKVPKMLAKEINLAPRKLEAFRGSMKSLVRLLVGAVEGRAM